MLKESPNRELFQMWFWFDNFLLISSYISNDKHDGYEASQSIYQASAKWCHIPLVKYGFPVESAEGQKHNRADCVGNFSSTETVDNNKAVTDTREAQRSVCTGWTDAQT